MVYVFTMRKRFFVENFALIDSGVFQELVYLYWLSNNMTL